ncbi:MAG: redox-active protein [Bacteroidota bacterium]|nr:redox-active protein [Bacteroidota bacterium]
MELKKMKNQYNRKGSELYFHTLPEKLNCAQAILKGFQKEFDITDQEIEEYRAWGGGRAQGGICGALFSSERLLRQAGKPGITEEFNERVGETRCLPIKSTNFPCIDCVRLADELVEKRMKQDSCPTSY